mmetsp:Transcript_698/g.1091  ORF Transcript_698/g.1091 Transcript_698/m.1091 type:complete len:96 (+) Transcript_698:232-519(+)
MKDLLASELKNVNYTPKEALNRSKDLTSKLLSMLKGMGYPRYKFICQVNIMSNDGQAIRVASRCLWDPEQDNFATAIFKNETLQCNAMVFGLFYE